MDFVDLHARATAAGLAAADDPPGVARIVLPTSNAGRFLRKQGIVGSWPVGYATEYVRVLNQAGELARVVKTA